jgi:hypothetical protein
MFRIAFVPQHCVAPYLPHSLLIERAGVLTCMPDFRATCLDMYVASRLDWITFPTKHSPILSLFTLDSVIAPTDECTARSVALNILNFPPKAPNGVRLAPTMYIAEREIDMLLDKPTKIC